MDLESKAGEAPLTAVPISTPEDRQNSRQVPSQKHNRRRRCICVSVTAVILTVVVLVVILAFTVFKPKKIDTTVNSTTLRDFDFSLDVSRFRASLNLTLDVNLSIRNPNKVGLKYRNSTATLTYRGEVVGEVPVPAGRVVSDGTTRMNLTLHLLADRLLTNQNLYNDVVSGTLPFTTSIRIAGKVRILFSFHVVAYATCNVNVAVSSQSIANQTCHYRTKL